MFEALSALRGIKTKISLSLGPERCKQQAEKTSRTFDLAEGKNPRSVREHREQSDQTHHFLVHFASKPRISVSKKSGMNKEHGNRNGITVILFG